MARVDSLTRRDLSRCPPIRIAEINTSRLRGGSYQSPRCSKPSAAIAHVPIMLRIRIALFIVIKKLIMNYCKDKCRGGRIHKLSVWLTIKFDRRDHLYILFISIRNFRATFYDWSDSFRRSIMIRHVLWLAQRNDIVDYLIMQCSWLRNPRYREALT